MKQKKVELFTILASAVAVSTLLLLPLLDPKESASIGAGCYHAIWLGMTDSQAYEMIGIPPGDHSGAFSYGTGTSLYNTQLGSAWTSYTENSDGTISAVDPGTGRPLRGFWWRGQQGMLVVFVNEDGRVVERRYYQGFPRNFWEHFCDRCFR